MGKRTLVGTLGVVMLLFAAVAQAQPLHISEFMALNDAGLQDDDGDFSDWIEIHNDGASPAALAGWSLTDSAATLNKWTFPAVTLPPGAYLVVFASDKNRTNPAAPLHTNFKLSGSGEYLGLVRPDLSIEDEYAPAFPPQIANVSYGLAGDLVSERCFVHATPGAANDESTSCAFAAEPTFDAAAGFFDASFSLSLATTTAGATIRYTTDGSRPTATSGAIYTSPIAISGTSTVRAATFKTDYQPSRVITRSYIFLDQVLTQTGAGFPTNTWKGDYAMDPDVVNNPLYSGTLKNDLKSIPTLSLVMDVGDLFGAELGIYANPGGRSDAWERPVSAELIHADGSPGFQGDAGIRIQGNYSRSSINPKHSLRLNFKADGGSGRMSFPLFADSPVASFEKLVLRAHYHNSWLTGTKQAHYINDQFTRDVQLAMGQPSARGMFVHVYLNGLYWGVYNLLERPDEVWDSDYFGGAPDDWDSLKHGTFSPEVLSGDLLAWNEAQALANQGLESPAAYAAIQEYVDVDNLIDYFIGSMYVGNIDWDKRNWYAARKREPGGKFVFLAWDSEQSMLSPTSNQTSRNNPGAPSRFYAKLSANPEFRQLFGDHLQRHLKNDGVLSPKGAAAIYAVRKAEIDRAIVGESARWGDAIYHQTTPYTRDNEWLVEIQRLNLVYFPQRARNVLEQFRARGLYPAIEAPSFSQHGGVIEPGFSLAMTASSGAIYYTTDGSDPRLSGGAVAPAATLYASPLTLSATTTVKARALLNSEWSALEVASFNVDVPLRITELMYNPGNDNLEFLEIKNVGSNPINLTGVKLSQGIDFTFASGTLAPGAFAVVASQLAGFQSRYGMSIPVAGVYSGKLSNGGERLRLSTAADETILDFTYSDAWEPSTDGPGYALVIRDPSSAASSWGNATSWRASSSLFGRPGAIDQRCGDGVDNDGDTLADFPLDGGCADALSESENAACDDGLDNDGDGLTDLADPQCSTASRSTEGFGPVDHFFCYSARTARGTTGAVSTPVTLSDAYDPSGPYVVGDRKAICLPADDGEGILDPNTALESYVLTGAHAAHLDVAVNNHLGPLFVDTSRVERLLVPTSLSESGPQPAPDFALHNVDHYKCYRVRRTQGTPAYFPTRVERQLADDFGDRNYGLREPKRMCIPTQVNGDVIKDPTRKLLCYGARKRPGQANHVEREGLYVANRFGSHRLDTTREAEWCVWSQ